MCARAIFYTFRMPVLHLFWFGWTGCFRSCQFDCSHHLSIQDPRLGYILISENVKISSIIMIICLYCFLLKFVRVPIQFLAVILRLCYCFCFDALASLQVTLVGSLFQLLKTVSLLSPISICSEAHPLSVKCTFSYKMVAFSILDSTDAQMWAQSCGGWDVVPCARSRSLSNDWIQKLKLGLTEIYLMVGYLWFNSGRWISSLRWIRQPAG